MRVRTLPVLAAPTGRALIHICGEGWCGPSGVKEDLRAALALVPSPSHPCPSSPSQDPLTLSKPVGHGPSGAPTRWEFPAERGEGWARGKRIENGVDRDESGVEGTKRYRCCLSSVSALSWWSDKRQCGRFQKCLTRSPDWAMVQRQGENGVARQKVG